MSFFQGNFLIRAYMSISQRQLRILPVQSLAIQYWSGDWLLLQGAYILTIYGWTRRLQLHTGLAQS
jgi:hypothetical protein